jgi:hypothetical protein
MTGPTGHIRPASIIGFREQCKSPLCMCHIWTPEAGVGYGDEVCAAAADLEVACRESWPANGSLPQIESLVSHLQTALRQVLDSIRSLAGVNAYSCAIRRSRCPRPFISLFVCQLQANCVIFSVDQGLEKCSGSACRRAIAITCALHVVHHAGRKKDTKGQQYNNEYNN